MSESMEPRLLLARLKAAEISANKRLGQHFLLDEEILGRIAAATQAGEETLVAEIGPGPAMLTTLLAGQAGGLIGVERDERFRPIHADIFRGMERTRFVYDDALKVDLWELARDAAAEWGLSRLVLAGNIPFQITSPLLFGQIGPDQPWERMVLMIQREVADRIVAGPRTREYGILSVKLAYWWRVAERFEVPAAKFSPRPKVDASVLVFTPTGAQERPEVSVWPGLSYFIDRAFNQRRKKLYNSPAFAAGGAEGKAALRGMLEALGLNPDARPEELSPGDFGRLYGMFAKGGGIL